MNTQVDKELFDEAMFHFHDAWSLIESAAAKTHGYQDDDGIFPMVRCAKEQMGEAGQLFYVMKEGAK